MEAYARHVRQRTEVVDWQKHPVDMLCDKDYLAQHLSGSMPAGPGLVNLHELQISDGVAFVSRDVSVLSAIPLSLCLSLPLFRDKPLFPCP